MSATTAPGVGPAVPEPHVHVVRGTPDDVELAALVAGLVAASGGAHEPPVDDDAPVPFDFTWAFVLRPADDGRTRLVVRERYGYRTGWAGRMVEPVSWVSFVMTERMLRGIRDRAERASARATAPASSPDETA